MIIFSHLSLPTNYSFNSAKTYGADSREYSKSAVDVADKSKKISGEKGQQIEKIARH